MSIKLAKKEPDSNELERSRETKLLKSVREIMLTKALTESFTN